MTTRSASPTACCAPRMRRATHLKTLFRVALSLAKADLPTLAAWRHGGMAHGSGFDDAHIMGD